MTLEDQMLLEEYQMDRKRFNEEQKLREQWDALMPPKAPALVPEQQRSTAQGNHSDRAVRYETETAIEGVM